MSGLLLAFAAVLALAAALIWLGIQQTRQPQAVASPPSPSTQVAAPTVPPTPPPVPSVAVVPAQEQPLTNAAPPVVRTEAASQAPPAAPAGPPLAALAASNLSSGDNARPVVETRPPPPRLQGIIFHPTRPSAVLNGRLVFVGERLGEWRVTAIDARSVTVVAAGQTNVLELP